MSGGKVTEEELRALAIVNSGVLPMLEVPVHEPSGPLRSLSTQEKNTWTRQDRFLRAFAVCRTKSAAARAAGIDRNTVIYWERHDTLGFKERFAHADEVFLNSLEDLALNRVRAQKPGDNPTLLIMLLNGNLPDKYRPNSVIPSETMTETLQAMKQATREFKKFEDGSETNVETETMVIVKKVIQ